jgi:hypothetical protein
MRYLPEIIKSVMSISNTSQLQNGIKNMINSNCSQMVNLVKVIGDIDMAWNMCGNIKDLLCFHKSGLRVIPDKVLRTFAVRCIDRAHVTNDTRFTSQYDCDHDNIAYQAMDTALKYANGLVTTEELNEIRYLAIQMVKIKERSSKEAKSKASSSSAQYLTSFLSDNYIPDYSSVSVYAARDAAYHLAMVEAYKAAASTLMEDSLQAAESTAYHVAMSCGWRKRRGPNYGSDLNPIQDVIDNQQEHQADLLRELYKDRNNITY